MNVGIGTVVTQFLSWEYLFRIFGFVSLQHNTAGPKVQQSQKILCVAQCGDDYLIQNMEAEPRSSTRHGRTTVLPVHRYLDSRSHKGNCRVDVINKLLYTNQLGVELGS
jgi:hypothetical protein